MLYRTDSKEPFVSFTLADKETARYCGLVLSGLATAHVVAYSAAEGVSATVFNEGDIDGPARQRMVQAVRAAAAVRKIDVEGIVYYSRPFTIQEVRDMAVVAEIADLS